MKKVLFICSMGRIRSKTAYKLYGGDYGGTDSDADKPITPEMIEHADIIYCMEMCHRSRIRRKFKGISHKIMVLNIPDEYDCMEPRLVALLEEKLGKYY